MLKHDQVKNDYFIDLKVCIYYKCLYYTTTYILVSSSLRINIFTSLSG